MLQGVDGPVFLSNVNACYSRACWAEIRFPEVAYAEDQAFAKAMLAAGWLKAYHPGAAVLHAHDYTPGEFMRRYFDEYRGLRETIGHVEDMSPRTVAGVTRRQVAADLGWMRREGLRGGSGRAGPPARSCITRPAGLRRARLAGSPAARGPAGAALARAQRGRREGARGGGTRRRYRARSGSARDPREPKLRTAVLEEVLRLSREGEAPLVDRPARASRSASACTWR